MAKAGSNMTGASGRLNDVVYRKGENGKTVMARYSKPSNPQTGGQMAQRIIWATVAQARAAMKPIVNHSFEGKTSEKLNLREFTRLNIARLRQLAALDFATKTFGPNSHMFVTTKKVSQLIPNSYIVAKGSLSKPFLGIDIDDTTPTAPELKVTVSNSGNDLGLVFENGKTTLGALANWLFGITSNEEMLTLAAIARNGEGYIYRYNDSGAAGQEIAYSGFNAKRLVVAIDVDFTQEVALEGESGFDLEESILGALATLFNDERTDQPLLNKLSEYIIAPALSVVTDNGVKKLVFNPANVEDATISGLYQLGGITAVAFAAGWIRSKYTNGSWKRSTAIMTLNRPTPDIEGNTERNFGLYWGIANAAWFQGEQLVESTKFLEEGQQVTQVGENF